MEHLIEQTEEVPSDSNRNVSCGKCQLGDISDGEGGDAPDTPEQITIVNGSGETIGLADCEDDDAAISNDVTTQSSSTFNPFHTNSRKRRLPAKFRDLLTEQAWEKVAESSLSPPKSNELEIDVSGLSSIRLKTKESLRGEEIISYLFRVEEKLDCIIKHFNVPLNNEPPAQKASPSSSFTHIMGKSAFRKSAVVSYSSLVHEPSTSTSVTTSVLRRQPNSTPTVRPTPEVGYITCDPPPTLPELTQYVISDDLLEATYMKSRNRGNFAKNLVYAAFPLEERLGRNCYGRRGGSLSGPKDPLEHAKLEAVRDAVFKKFPVLDGDDYEAVWKRECVIAIDTALRSEMRTRILNMQNIIKHEIMQNNIKSEVKNTMNNVTM